MRHPIAITGMACRYPDADSPQALWDNVLAKRRAFRRIPKERFCLDDYWSSDRASVDRTYGTLAAVIEGYEFDRVRFRVAGSTYRSADLVHWLALDIADQALADAGFDKGSGLPLQTTGVIVGNTLTGEFARASLMRLRWPYVSRVLDAYLAEQGWSPDRRARLLVAVERSYKAPFAEIGEESLAGGLSNTIAGRICNHFDLHGGGYTVDGACASSLLALITACNSLATGDLDVAVAGGVDLSLDPFELVGFAKVGALADGEMRIYDRGSAGFWPGEGCGFVVLMRLEDAQAADRRIYATITGWGISSDGSGGITRPEVAGQVLALERAYRGLRRGPLSVALFEGHGTGTAVGDQTELAALNQARRATGNSVERAAIGSIKANIGHTKAAAGVAGVIKASMSLHRRIIPPTTGCEEPHEKLVGPAATLRRVDEAEVWPPAAPLRAGVSAMGFGGINTHLVLEGDASARRRRTLTTREQTLVSTPQDAELFVLAAASRVQLIVAIHDLAATASGISLAELADLSAALATRTHRGAVRAAVVAQTPSELAKRLRRLAAVVERGADRHLDPARGTFAHASNGSAPRVTYLFPGQASSTYRDGGCWSRRFPEVRSLYASADLRPERSRGDTEAAQPAIMIASVAGLDVLDRMGVEADRAVGHSLGELTALYWGGALDRVSLLELTRARGRIMGALPRGEGGMASVMADAATLEPLLHGLELVVAAINGPAHTTVSGRQAAVDALVERAARARLVATRLPVSHAFHSPLMNPVTGPLAQLLDTLAVEAPLRRVVSTVTGQVLPADQDLRQLLVDQLTRPVRFSEALELAADGADLLIEVGPGTVLAGLCQHTIDVPAVALDAGGSSIRGLLATAAALFCLGADIDLSSLFEGRALRPFDLGAKRRFLINPCELAPDRSSREEAETGAPVPPPERVSITDVIPERHPPDTAVELIRRLVAARAELPIEAVTEDSQLLDDLHLSSIIVAQIVVEATRACGLAPPAAPTNLATATVRQLADALETLQQIDPDSDASTASRLNSPAPAGGPEAHEAVPGVGTWVRAFTTTLQPAVAPSATVTQGWVVAAPAGHPLADPLRWLGGRDSDPDTVVVCLPERPGDDAIALLRDAMRPLFDRGRGHLVLVQGEHGAAAVARTLHLEFPAIATTVVTTPFIPPAAGWVAREIASPSGHQEVVYNDAGDRQVPVLRLLRLQELEPCPGLSTEDVLVVSGGGKGIGAESALWLAQQTGARIALLGRSVPGHDEELAANLDRFAAAGVQYRYLQADVTDAQAIAAALQVARDELGSLTALLHAAGMNRPTLLTELDDAAFRETLRPKVEGLRVLLSSLDADPVRLVIAYSSIIARAGLRGEAHYALANEWMGHALGRYCAGRPSCRGLTVEWSVWSGVGMGERLGTIDFLARNGVTPIPPETGLRMLEALTTKHTPATVLVAGRFGPPPTVRLDEPGLPLLRFVEHVLVHYPGIELVVEAELSHRHDPYLADHVIDGVTLLPGVLGLEAMAQVAMALTSSIPPVLEGIEFLRPVVVPADRPQPVRIAALVGEDGTVAVTLRSAETAFEADHFRAVCRFGVPLQPARETVLPEDTGSSMVSVEGWYGSLFFHGPRFRRVRGYRELRARRCVAEVDLRTHATWFDQFLPGELLLGDPGALDACIHAVQACIPHERLLPVAVTRLELLGWPLEGPLTVEAVERSASGEQFVYDVEGCGPDGRPCLRLTGLVLQRAGALEAPGWPSPLLCPYLERQLGARYPGADLLVGLSAGSEQRAHSGAALNGAMGPTLVLASSRPVGCDVRTVEPRPVEQWQHLLGRQRFDLAEALARGSGRTLDVAATGVWAAGESLVNAGRPAGERLTIRQCDGTWAELVAGATKVVLWITRDGAGRQVVIGAAVQELPHGA